MIRTNRLSTIHGLAILGCAAAALGAADAAPAAPAAAAPAAPADGRGIYDLLGGATWSERRAEVTAGLSELHVDGVDGRQRAVYLSGSATALSGYQASGERPFGSILGVGASLKTWWGNDEVDVSVIAPFAYGVGGTFAQLSERTRLELTGRLGPGLGWVSVDGERELGFAWTWGLEASVTLTKGDSVGLGLGLGYEEVHLKDVEHDAVYVALRFGF